jgi:hypothetical protein
MRLLPCFSLMVSSVPTSDLGPQVAFPSHAFRVSSNLPWSLISLSSTISTPLKNTVKCYVEVPTILVFVMFSWGLHWSYGFGRKSNPRCNACLIVSSKEPPDFPLWCYLHHLAEVVPVRFFCWIFLFVTIRYSMETFWGSVASCLSLQAPDFP